MKYVRKTFTVSIPAYIKYSISGALHTINWCSLFKKQSTILEEI
jgi:hypothetical protein